MAGETISHGGYELDDNQQRCIGRKLEGLVRDCLLSAPTTRLSSSFASPHYLGSGRCEYLLYLRDKDGQDERIYVEMATMIVDISDVINNSLKSEFPELKNVKLELRAGGCLAVTCTLDEVVDSTPETTDAILARLQRLSAEDLTSRGDLAYAALVLKGRELFFSLGIDGIRFVSAKFRGGRVVCVVTCPAEAFRAFNGKMRDFGVVYSDHTMESKASSLELVCQVSPEVFDSGVWPEVKGVAGGVAEDVAAVAGGSGSES